MKASKKENSIAKRLLSLAVAFSIAAQPALSTVTSVYAEDIEEEPVTETVEETEEVAEEESIPEVAEEPEETVEETEAPVIEETEEPVIEETEEPVIEETEEPVIEETEEPVIEETEEPVIEETEEPVIEETEEPVIEETEEPAVEETEEPVVEETEETVTEEKANAVDDVAITGYSVDPAPAEGETTVTTTNEKVVVTVSFENYEGLECSFDPSNIENVEYKWDAETGKFTVTITNDVDALKDVDLVFSDGESTTTVTAKITEHLTKVTFEAEEPPYFQNIKVGDAKLTKGTATDGVIYTNKYDAEQAIITVELTNVPKTEEASYEYDEEISGFSVVPEFHNNRRTLKFTFKSKAVTADGKVDLPSDYTVTFKSTDTNGRPVTKDVVIDLTKALSSIVYEKVLPVIGIEYDNNTVVEGYEDLFNDKRVATITVTEDNFDPSLITINTTGTVSEWNGKTATVTFEEGKHTLEVSGTDMAGNDADVSFGGGTVAGAAFEIDMTGPVITVSYNVNEGHGWGGMTFWQPRIATVTVTDKNFDPEKIKITTNGTIAGDFAETGEDTYEVNVNFTEDSQYNHGTHTYVPYTFTIEGTDALGNEGSVSYGNSNCPNEFYISLHLPLVTITFDNDTVYHGKYFDAPRTATIEVLTRGFYENNIQMSLKKNGETITNPEIEYVQDGSDPFKYTGTYTFEDDGAYELSYKYYDQVVGRETTATSTSKAWNNFVIDTVQPQIDIVFDNNAPYKEYYFDKERTATVTVTDANFYSKLIDIIPADLVSDFEDIGENKHQATVAFTDDGLYQFAAAGKDLANNEAVVTFAEETVYPDEFVIDKTAPKVTVVFDNNEASNSKYFSADRTATVTVEDENFASNLIKIDTQESATVTWDEEKKTATIVYDTDGDYTLAISGEDRSGNKFTDDAVEYGDSVAPREFTIDKTAPVITVTYDNNEVANKKYFNAERTATVTVVEHNCTAENVNDLVKIETQIQPIKLVPVEGKTDTYAVDIKYEADDKYTLEVTGKDMADNEADVEYKGKAPQEFVIDKTAPVLTISYSGKPATIDGKDERTLYFNKNVDVTFKFEEENKEKVFYTIIPTEDGQDGNTISVNKDEFMYTIEGVAEKETVFNNFRVYGTDLAGNALTVIEERVDAAANESFNHDEDAQYGTVETIVVDIVAPKVTVTYSGRPHTIEGDDVRTLYFNSEVTVKFALKEGNVADDGFTVKSIEDGEMTQMDNYLKTTSVVISGGAANETVKHRYRIWGLDKAGNPVTVIEKTPDGDNKTGIKAVTSTGNSSEKASYKTSNRIIVDTVAPTYTISMPSVKHDYSVEYYGGKYYAYYNKSQLTANAAITEGNFDSARIGMDLVKGTKGLVHDATFTYKSPAGGTNYVKDTKKYSVTATDNGTYRFTIMGEDKAGNKLVPSAAETGKEDDYQKTIKVRAGNYWTGVKVIDRVLDGTLYVSDTTGTKNSYLTVSSLKDNNVSQNGLFRKAAEAYINISTSGEVSPYKIAYSIASRGGTAIEKTLEDLNFNYSNNISDLKIAGEQKFAIKSVTLLDRAGNKVDLSLSGYPVYLDVTNPESTILDQKTDIHSPVATIKATTAVTNRNADGRDLFNKSVDVKLEVDDPRFKDTNISSGIDTITCVVTVDGSQVGESFTVSKYSDGNEKGGSNFQRTITIPAGTYESNNIVVTLEAVDRSGNKSNKAEYKFGIDTVGPEVTVSYDNNDVQNEKYFKADRTATITVVDRNIDASKITITTEVGVPDSFSYTDGGGNGGSDVWTKVLGYNADGDYTLEITGTDALGNAFKGEVNYTGEAPREFTIDKTAPVIDLSFDQTPFSENYYNQPRTGSITITEHNFRASDVTVSSIDGGTVYSVGFSEGSDVHTGSQYFDQEGHFDMRVEYTDLAGNPAEFRDESEFVIDLTAPAVEITGLEGQPFGPNEEVQPIVTMSDTNFINDSNFIRLTLTGNKNGNVTVAYVPENVTNEGLAAYITNLLDTSKATDDIYTLSATITDRAGNITTVSSEPFSVNKYGSTFEIVSMPQNYYGQELQGQVQIREINVVQVPEENVTVTVYENGSPRTLSASEYTRSSAEFGTNGYEYVYTVNPSVFSGEGTYSVVISTVDATGNTNTSTAFFNNEGQDDARNVEFAIDKTAPSYTVNLEADSKKVVDAAEFPVNVYPFDNMAVSKVIIEAGDHKAEFTGEELEKAMKENGYVTLTLPEADADYTVKVTVVDAAGNQIGEDEYQLLVNTSFYVRNKTAILAGGGGGAALLLLLLLLLKRRKKDDEDQAA